MEQWVRDMKDIRSRVTNIYIYSTKIDKKLFDEMYNELGESDLQ